MSKNVTVILPTYNEKENIEKLIREVHKYTGKDLKEIIVVDDNSPDKTYNIVEDLMSEFKNLRLIRRVNEKGLPGAIIAGIKAGKGDYFIWMDCDLSHPPKYIPKLLKEVPQYDLIVASRYVKGGRDIRPFSRVLASKFFSISANLLLNLKVKDVTSGFFVVKKDVFRKMGIKKDGYAEYCIRLVNQARRKGFKIKEVPYSFVDREKGTSKTDSNIKNFLYNGYLCMKEIIYQML